MVPTASSQVHSQVHSQVVSSDASRPEISGQQAASTPREHYIDRLRTALTVLVIFCHSGMTYGGRGNWFYRELEPSGRPTSELFTFVIATTQAFSMGFFFFLSGYFTPRPLERKGYVRFLADRFLRLGVPLLAFVFLLGPFTSALVDWTEGRGFWATFAWLWRHHRAINGPLWFAEALLIFSIGYCAWRAVFGAPLAQAVRKPKPVPSQIWWIAAAVGTGLGSFLIRLANPIGHTRLGLQLGFFSGYIALFAIGIAAWRHDWLRQLKWKDGRPWVIIFLLAWPILPIVYLLTSGPLGPSGADFAGGFVWPSFVYSLWEPLVAWGLICLYLLVFRRAMNQPSAAWDWLDRRAYAVYIVHSPVLVAITLALRHWMAPAIVKFSAAGVLACVGCWLISEPILRIPGIRRIV